MLRQIKLPSYPTRLPVLRKLFLCLLSAVLLIFSFPRFNFEFLAWIGFVPLLFSLKNKPKLQAFLLSYLTGVIFWSGIIYWLIHVTLPGMVILILYLALYFGLFGFIISTINSELTTVNLLFIPAVWVLLEYLRSYLLTGFPWALMGYSQHLNLPIIQIADTTGVWGVSFLVVMINTVVYSVLSFQFSVFSKLKNFLLPLLFILITLIYGSYKLLPQPPTHQPQLLKISVIQGNIPQELKWSESARGFIMERYFDLTKEAMRDNPDFIIWPEAALPVTLEEEPVYFNKVRGLAKNMRTPLLLGAVTKRDDYYYNSALLVSGKGRLLNKYDKLHLVPFGEYIPFRNSFTFLEAVVPISDFTSGKEYTIFELSAKFGVLICFEDLFPALSRQFRKRGADFLINITNDAWFGKTSSAHQHLTASVFRAVENRVAVVRCANTGVSGFIKPSGKIASLVNNGASEEIFVSGYKVAKVIVQKKNLSFYSRYGDIFIFLLLIFALCSIFRLICTPKK